MLSNKVTRIYYNYITMLLQITYNFSKVVDWAYVWKLEITSCFNGLNPG